MSEVSLMEFQAIEIAIGIFIITSVIVGLATVVLIAKRFLK